MSQRHVYKGCATFNIKVNHNKGKKTLKLSDCNQQKSSFFPFGLLFSLQTKIAKIPFEKTNPPLSSSFLFKWSPSKLTFLSSLFHPWTNFFALLKKKSKLFLFSLFFFLSPSTNPFPIPLWLFIATW